MKKVFFYVRKKSYTSLENTYVEQLNEEVANEGTQDSVGHKNLSDKAFGLPCLPGLQFRPTKCDLPSLNAQLGSNTKDTQNIGLTNKQKRGVRSVSRCHCVDYELQALTKARLRFRRRAMGELELKKDLKELYDMFLQRNLREMNLL